MRLGKRERLARRQEKQALALAQANRLAKVIAPASLAIAPTRMVVVGKSMPDWGYISPIRGMRAGFQHGKGCKPGRVLAKA